MHILVGFYLRKLQNFLTQLKPRSDQVKGNNMNMTSGQKEIFSFELFDVIQFFVLIFLKRRNFSIGKFL